MRRQRSTSNPAAGKKAAKTANGSNMKLTMSSSSSATSTSATNTVNTRANRSCKVGNNSSSNSTNSRQNANNNSNGVKRPLIGSINRGKGRQQQQQQQLVRSTPCDPCCDNSNDSGLGFDHHMESRSTTSFYTSSDAKRRKHELNTNSSSNSSNSSTSNALNSNNNINSNGKSQLMLEVDDDDINDSYSFPENISYREAAMVMRTTPILNSVLVRSNTVANTTPRLVVPSNTNTSGGKRQLATLYSNNSSQQQQVTLTSQLSNTSRNGKYQLQIICQPEQQHRARYQTEGSRGAVKDASGNGFPMVRLTGYSRPTVLQVFIGTDSGRVLPHMFYQACRVTGKNSTACSEHRIDGTVVIQLELEPSKDMTATCDCVGILKERNVDVEHRFPDQNGGQRSKKKSTRCRMVFRALLDSGEVLQACSQAIVCTQPPGVPEICKKSLTACSCAGGQELFILGKNFLKDTHVVFQQTASSTTSSSGENDTDDIVWEESVLPDKEYLQQTHLVCQIPAYRRLDISEPVVVQFHIRSGGRTSEAHALTYTPLPNNAGSSAMSPSSPLLLWPTSNSSGKRDLVDVGMMPPPQLLPQRRPSSSASVGLLLKQEIIMDDNSCSSNGDREMAAEEEEGEQMAVVAEPLPPLPLSLSLSLPPPPASLPSPQPSLAITLPPPPQPSLSIIPTPAESVADLATAQAPSMATLQRFVTSAAEGDAPLPTQSAQSVENYLTRIEMPPFAGSGGGNSGGSGGGVAVVYTNGAAPPQPPQPSQPPTTTVAAPAAVQQTQQQQLCALFAREDAAAVVSAVVSEPQLSAVNLLTANFVANGSDKLLSAGASPLQPAICPSLLHFASNSRENTSTTADQQNNSGGHLLTAGDASSGLFTNQSDKLLSAGASPLQPALCPSLLYSSNSRENTAASAEQQNNSGGHLLTSGDASSGLFANQSDKLLSASASPLQPALCPSMLYAGNSENTAASAEQQSNNGGHLLTAGDASSALFTNQSEKLLSAGASPLQPALCPSLLYSSNSENTAANADQQNNSGGHLLTAGEASSALFANQSDKLLSASASPLTPALCSSLLYTSNSAENTSSTAEQQLCSNNSVTNGSHLLTTTPPTNTNTSSALFANQTEKLLAGAAPPSVALCNSLHLFAASSNAEATAMAAGAAPPTQPQQLLAFAPAAGDGLVVAADTAAAAASLPVAPAPAPPPSTGGLTSEVMTQIAPNHLLCQVLSSTATNTSNSLNPPPPLPALSTPLSPTTSSAAATTCSQVLINAAVDYLETRKQIEAINSNGSGAAVESVKKDGFISMSDSDLISFINPSCFEASGGEAQFIV